MTETDKMSQIKSWQRGLSNDILWCDVIWHHQSGQKGITKMNCFSEEYLLNIYSFPQYLRYVILIVNCDNLLLFKQFLYHQFFYDLAIILKLDPPPFSPLDIHFLYTVFGHYSMGRITLSSIDNQVVNGISERILLQCDHLYTILCKPF